MHAPTESLVFKKLEKEIFFKFPPGIIILYNEIKKLNNLYNKNKYIAYTIMEKAINKGRLMETSAAALEKNLNPFMGK